MIEKESNHYHDNSSVNSSNSNNLNNNSGGNMKSNNAGDSGVAVSSGNNLEIHGNQAYNEDTIHKVNTEFN